MENYRKSNLELLRIVCMFLIVSFHFCVHGNLWTISNEANKIIVNIILPFGKICFDCFIVLSCWFLTNSKFKGEKFWKLWFEVLFYNILFTLIAFKFQSKDNVVGVKQIVGSLFPILGNSHGYAASYMAFYLLLPIIQKIQAGLTKTGTLYIIYILSATQIVCPVIAQYIDYMQPFTCEILLFVLIYFIVFFIQNWPMRVLQKRGICFAIFIAVLFLAWGANIMSIYTSNSFINFVWSIQSTESGILNILMGLLLFLIVKDFNMPYCPIINLIASTTFGVLLFHDHNFFRLLVWKIPEGLYDYNMISAPKFICIILFVSMCVFGVGMIVDLLRKELFESRILRSGLFNYLVKILNQISSQFS